jgi:putative flippase GtrA
VSARTPFAYVIIAGSCLLLHNLILIGSNAAHIPLWLAILMSFATVASSGYVLHAIFTFRQPLSFSRLVRYAVAMSANIPLAYVTTWFWYAGLGLPMPVAAPIASGCMFALNFVLGRWAIAAPKVPATDVR